MAKQYAKSDTIIKVGFIVMRHNELEIPRFEEWARSLGVIPEIINPCVRNIEQAYEFMPNYHGFWFYDFDAYCQGKLIPKKVPHNRCWWIYYSTVICWNGDVVPCCRDAQGDYIMGNVLTQDFKEIWNSEKYKKFRHEIANRQSEVGLCRLCSGYGVPRLR
jgi:radical SAM protein with 4Fe4S-binding SPASM domain